MSAKRPKYTKKSIPALTGKEREELAEILDTPLMQRALALANMSRPSMFYTGAGKEVLACKDAALATLAANNVLHEQRGWEMHEVALFRLTLDPKVAEVTPEETYPEVE